jgi:hypothetical protein
MSESVLYADFSKIDEILRPWAERRGVHVFESLEDSPPRLVRSRQRFGDLGTIVRNMWIDAPDQKGRVVVHAVASHFIGDTEAAITWRLDQTTELTNLRDVLSSVHDRLLAAPHSKRS